MLIVCVAILLAAFGEQFAHFGVMQAGVLADEIKPMLLLAVLYHLVLITVTREHQNAGIAWTYELETEIVLGEISPEVAIRRIENRRLGSRLQDVVDRFFDDLDQRLTEVDSRLTECSKKIGDAKAVPEQYPAERAARVSAASEDVVGRINAIAADCKEFRYYLAKLEEKARGGRMAAMPPVIANLISRHATYDERVRTAKLQLKRLLN